MLDESLGKVQVIAVITLETMFLHGYPAKLIVSKDADKARFYGFDNAKVSPVAVTVNEVMSKS